MTQVSEYFYAYVVTQNTDEEWTPRAMMVSPPGQAVKDFCEVGNEFFDMETHRISRIETLDEFGKVLLATDKHGIHQDYMGQEVLFEDGPVSIATLMGLTDED